MLLLDPCTHELFAVNAYQRFTTRYLLKIQNWVIFLPFQLTNLFYFLAVLEILITKANKNIVKQRFCLLRHFLHVQLHCNFSNHLILLVVYFDWHDLLYIDYTRGCHPEKTTVDRGKAEIDNGWFSIRYEKLLHYKQLYTEVRSVYDVTGAVSYVKSKCCSRSTQFDFKNGIIALWSQ